MAYISVLSGPGATHSPKMDVGEDGRASHAIWIGSPNFDARPDCEPISLLVVHNISLPPGEFGGDGVVRLFTNSLDITAHPYYYAHLRDVKVSAHFLVCRDGALFQFVSCNERAWHAGLSNWRGRDRCNDFSVGVELEGSDGLSYTDSQYDILVVLTRALRARYPIAELVGHSDIAPGRKTDPGQAFDWGRYRAMLGV